MDSVERVKDICKERVPEYREIEPGHFTQCHMVNGEF